MQMKRWMVVSAAFTLISSAPMSVLGDHHGNKAGIDKGALRETAKQLFGPLPDKMPGSENDTDVRIALGERLFFDKRLSANDTQSCNSCHRVDEGLGGVDNLSFSPGAFPGRGGRNAPTVLNAGFALSQFWDGRAKDLQAQAKGPILNPVEMAMPSEAAVMDKVRKDSEYRKLFRKAFGEDSSPMTYDNLAEAIAAFERTLITRDRFDAFQKGDDDALTDQELRGLQKVMTMGCATCHNGPLMGGGSYQKLGLVNPYPNFNDTGRAEVTGKEADKYFFKVPTLRNIAMQLADTVTHGDVLTAIRKAKPKHIDQVNLFDVYRGKGIPEGQKSVAYAITYRHSAKTLTDNEINPVHDGLVKKLQSTIGAQIR
jgi:cytochrome c peroxidase